MDSTKTIISHTVIYGIGRALRSIASFVMLPIYTRYLTPTDYGLIALLNVVLDLTALLIGSRLAVGVFKYYSDAQTPMAKRQVLSTSMLLLFIVNLVGVLLLCVLSGEVTILLDAPEGFSLALKIFAINLIFSAINEIFFSYLRILDKPIAYILVNFFKLVTQIALNILFIVYLEYGYWGMIWGGVLSSGFLMLAFCLWLMPSIGFNISADYRKKLINFSFPIILSSLAMYYITFGDRYFIKYYHGIDDVGIYALAYQFGFILVTVVWSPFSTYWEAQQYHYGRSADATHFFGQVFFYVNLLLLTAASGIVVLAPHFLFIFAAEDFWSAITIVPWIVCAYVFQCWIQFMQFGILQAGKTKFIAVGTFLSAFVITILYFWWIPEYGSVGAAKATLCAFIIRFIYTYLVSQKLFAIDIPWLRLGLVIGYFLALTMLLRSWALDDHYALVVKSLVLICCGACLLFSPIVAPSHRDVVYSSIKKFFL